MTTWKMNGFECEFCACVFMVDVDEGEEMTCPKCKSKNPHCVGSGEAEFPSVK